MPTGTPAHSVEPRRIRLPRRTPPLDVWVAGDGDPIVLLHGWGLSGRAYREPMRALASRGRRVAAPSLTPSEKRYSLESVAERAADAISSLGIERAPVVGHSFGAAVAVRLAGDRPDLVSALVLVDPVGVSPGVMRLARIAVPGPHWRVAANRPTASALLSSFSARGAIAGLRGSVRWILTGTLDEELTMLRECAMPAVVLWAESESLLPRSTGMREAELLGCAFKIVGAEPGWPQRRLPDHDWPFRAPAFFATKVLAEIQELFPE